MKDATVCELAMSADENADRRFLGHRLIITIEKAGVPGADGTDSDFEGAARMFPRQGTSMRADGEIRRRQIGASIT
jgi:hypothetical protein